MGDVVENILIILKQRIGLDVNTVGRSTIEQTLLQRMASQGISDLNEYYRLISIDANELTELLEASVIPETWFFRDIQPYEIIYKNILSQQLKNPGSVYRILSLPCSSGEEPYSLAMYLLEHNISEKLFSIDACDVSIRAINKSRNGIYGNNSFRGKNFKTYQSRYFTESDGFYHISEKIKNTVNFSIKNILKRDSLNHNTYDAIICRNLLIYFDNNTKLIAYRHLIEAMKISGSLFIGHSEFGSVPSDKLVNTGSKNGFALKRADNPELEQSGIKRLLDPHGLGKVTNRLKAISSKVPARKVSAFIKALKPASSKATSDNHQGTSIVEAIKLADQKQFEKAESICRQLLDNNQDSEEAYYLLGLIEYSRYKIDEAESLFRKALFLNPKHYKSLSQMAALLKARGDTRNAELFKNRAERATTESNR